MSIYVPRPAQLAMLKGMATRPRTQLVAGMGTGKTGALLVHASSAMLHYGRFPGMLVLAPTLVCMSWANEIRNWAPDLRVCPLLGSTKEKAAALRRGGDVYLMNYEGLPWLHSALPNWGSIARIMVCDESTRVKHVRSHWRTSPNGKHFVMPQGGANMNALSRHVADFDQWVNATGTVSPNGVKDIWGQYWFIDGGRRLGNSYADFEARFLWNSAPYGEHPKWEPKPGAQEEIVRLVADITTTVRTEDYYQLDAPFTVRREVHLPPAVRAEYARMEAKAVLEITTALANHEVTAENASAKTRKLLQVAAGFVYHGDPAGEASDGPAPVQITHLHDAKIKAIESILEETDEPLVVVFYHRGFAEGLRAKFKDQVAIIDDKNFQAVQDRWNSGKQRILAFQYAKGAYGLSLQHGGRNICFAEPTYISDHYSQAIERLGPMRQAQSGYQRSVNVFELCSVGTIDERVYEVAEGKITAEQAFTLALRDASNRVT